MLKFRNNLFRNAKQSQIQINFLTNFQIRNFPRAIPGVPKQYLNTDEFLEDQNREQIIKEPKQKKSIAQRLEEAKLQKEKWMKEMEDEELTEMMQKEVENDPGFGYGEERVYDKKYKEYSPYALLSLPIDRVPEDIQKRMIKVFSKHRVTDVRQWSKQLMQSYQLLHAVEKPMNLDYAKPFSNTSDLKNMTPKIFSDIAQKKKEQQNKTDLEDDTSSFKQKIEKQEIKLDQDPISKLITNAREAEGKRASKFDLKDEQENQEFNLFYQREHTIAYLLRKMPYHYQVFKRLILEVQNRVNGFELQDQEDSQKLKPEEKLSILDYGAGLGSGLWAVMHAYQNDQILRVAAVEPNLNMRKLGKFLTEELNKENNILWVDSLAMIPGQGGERGKFDIVILGYVLQEIKTQQGRLMVIDALWQRLKDGGVILVVEPGSPKGFRYIHSFREWVLAKSRDEASIVAPCPHHGKCPMAQNPDLWCHFSQITQKLPNDVFPKKPNEPDSVNEKFSYLIVRKNKKIPNFEFKNVNQAKSAQEKSYFWPRIIRPIMKKHKHTIIDLCSIDSGKNGLLERRIIAKSHGLEGGYRLAKKMKWGDLWYFTNRIPNKFRKEAKYGKRLW